MPIVGVINRDPERILSIIGIDDFLNPTESIYPAFSRGELALLLGLEHRIIHLAHSRIVLSNQLASLT